MNNPILFLMILLLYFVTLSTPFNCQAFRCGDEFVSGSDSTGKVIARCGEPDERIVSRRTASGEYLDDSLFDEQGSYKGFGYVTAYITEEKWYYNCGDNDFRYELKFENDVMVSEDNAGRGHGPNRCISGREQLERDMKKPRVKMISKRGEARKDYNTRICPSNSIDLRQLRNQHMAKARELFPDETNMTKLFEMYRQQYMTDEERKQMPLYITMDTNPCVPKHHNPNTLISTKSYKPSPAEIKAETKQKSSINNSESSFWFQCKDRDGNVTFSNVGCPE
jgi:hypothetical protein